MSYRVILGFLFGALTLSQCGFQPMYGKEDGDLHEEFRLIHLEPIADRSGQIMRNELQKLLYVRPKAKESKYDLSVTITTTDQKLTYLSDQTAGRKQVTATAGFRLVEKGSGKLLHSGTVSRSADYSVASGNTYSTIISAERVKQDAINAAARDLKISLAEFLKNRQYKETALAENEKRIVVEV